MTTVERTNRWRHAFTIVLVTSLVGVYTEQPSILLASIIGIAYMAYPLLSSEPTIDLALSRTVSDKSPEHGDPVTVTVSVTNTGARTVADLRLIDGVPPLLAVTNGTARHTATLRPSDSTAFQYTVTAKHGVHQFEPATAIVHDISGSRRVQTSITPDMEKSIYTLDCSVNIHITSLQQRIQQYAGPSTSAKRGAGIEFYQTRTYHHGDPANRINWRRFARTGELTTVEYRAERLHSVVLCLDARPKSIRNSQPTEPHAVAYSVAAATELLSIFREQGKRVGTAVFGSEFAWIDPDTGYYHYEQAKQLLKTHRSWNSTQTDAHQKMTTPSEQLRTLFRQSRDTVEVILFTPLLDDFGVTTAQQLEANGRTVTVISPDSTTKETLKGTLVRIERRNRVQSLQKSRVPVCDWTPGNPIVWNEAQRKRT